MKIELKKYPRYTGANDENSVIYLFVNGYNIGVYYGGSKRHYLEPEKWAKRQVKNRLVVIERNINRLTKELKELRAEKIALNEKN